MFFFLLIDLINKSDEKCNQRCKLFKFVMYGPVLVTIGALGIIGNILSIIVFSRASMDKSAINVILIGKYKNLTNI